MPKRTTNFDKLTLSSDFLFKYVMHREHICKHFLEELLHTKIANISYLEVEKTIDVYPDSRGIRLDITVADNNNIHYNIEMQVRNTVNTQTHESLLPKRTRYYQAMLDVANLQKHQDFDVLPPTYIIFVCPFDFIGDNQRIYTFQKRCIENPAIGLNDESTIIFLNTKSTKGLISSDIQSLYDYINNNTTITSNFVKEVNNTVIAIKNDKKVRRAFMTYEMKMKDLRNEALAEGKFEATYNDIKNLMSSFSCSIDKAMDALKIPAENRQYYKDHLAKES